MQTKRISTLAENHDNIFGNQFGQESKRIDLELEHQWLLD